jgi:hypothetical protein
VIYDTCLSLESSPYNTIDRDNDLTDISYRKIKLRRLRKAANNYNAAGIKEDEVEAAAEST